MGDDIKERLGRALGTSQATTNAPKPAAPVAVVPETQMSGSWVISKRAKQVERSQRVLVEIPEDLAVWLKVLAVKFKVNLSDVYFDALSEYRNSKEGNKNVG